MTVYIDKDFKCHTVNDGTMTAVEEAFFENKCNAFIEGYRLKPDGETCVREDGVVFSGCKMISPWKDSDELEAAQNLYESEHLADLEEFARIILGGESV